ncbi:putative RNA-directed DNA polymerase, eukaryota, reverse transcriptase zinc-binding domain protein [Tanacetum coccineum]
MVNVYGPHVLDAKVILWQKLTFIHQHQGKYVLFDDLVYSTSEAQIFNSFIESSGLKEMLMGGKSFTWMNKSGTKMSRLDRVLISDEVLDENIDLKAIVLDRLKDIGDVIKQAFADCSQDTVELRVPLHEVITLIKDIEIKLDASLASDIEKETRLQLLREINEIDRLESMDIVQKARKLSTQEKNDLECPVSSDEIKKAVWDCDGDKAPGSGGFLFKILKRYREIFKFDMELFVSDFFTKLRMPPGTNSAFITLLPKFGFGEKWRNQIQACLQFARTSILVNESPTSEFSIKRGLRQGDPLSPFLFILIMEGLHIAIKDVNHLNLIKGVSVGNPGIRLSHFFYVDDVVLVTERNHRDMDNILRLFIVFFLASGLHINVQKSNVYGVGVLTEEVEDMARATGCSSGSFPFTYLGLPIGVSMNMINHWQDMLDKFENRLSKWKANLLSIGGRSTLVKAVLGSACTYHMSIFKVPESILSSLERFRSRFFWGVDKGTKNMI